MHNTKQVSSFQSVYTMLDVKKRAEKKIFWTWKIMDLSHRGMCAIISRHLHDVFVLLMGEAIWQRKKESEGF